MQLDLTNKQVLVLPADKKVTMVEFEDGSAEIYLDLSNDIISFLYQRATELDCSFDEALEKTLMESMDRLETEENSKWLEEEFPTKVWKKNVKKTKKTRKQ